MGTEPTLAVWLSTGRRAISDSCVLLYCTSIDIEERAIRALSGQLVVGAVAARDELTRRTSHSSQPNAPLDLVRLTSLGLEVAEMTVDEQLLFVQDDAALRRRGQRMGRGELEAVVLAHSRGWAVLTEDRRARNKMAVLHPQVPVFGVEDLLGVLLAREVMTLDERTKLLSTLRRERGGL